MTDEIIKDCAKHILAQVQWTSGEVDGFYADMGEEWSPPDNWTDDSPVITLSPQAESQITINTRYIKSKAFYKSFELCHILLVGS